LILRFGKKVVERCDFICHRRGAHAGMNGCCQVFYDAI
jgi:hypothetical protein